MITPLPLTENKSENPLATDLYKNMPKSLNQPLWERRRFGERRNYLKEGLIKFGYWHKLDINTKGIIEKVTKI